VAEPADNFERRIRFLQTVRLADLLDEAKSRCKASIRGRREEKGEPIDEEELDKSAAIMGYAAVKYFDLKNNRKTDYK
jgi:arginyl-tRNA synthetase